MPICSYLQRVPRSGATLTKTTVPVRHEKLSRRVDLVDQTKLNSRTHESAPVERLSGQHTLAPLHTEAFKQRDGFFQIGGVKPFGEPPVDRREHLARFGLPTLLLIEAAHAHDGSQFERFGLLLAGNVDRSMKAGFRFYRIAQ